MAEIIHRYVNGMEVSSEDLIRYQITNRTVLEIIHNAIRRNARTPSAKEPCENTPG